MQELCHQSLRARDSIIKNERVNSINMSLQFTSSFVRRMLHPPKPICPARTFYIVLRNRALDGFFAGQQWPGGSSGIRLVAPGIRHSPSPHREQGAGWRRRPDSNRWMEVLQTSALPLGYVATMPILAYSRWAVKVLILGTLHAMMQVI